MFSNNDPDASSASQFRFRIAILLIVMLGVFAALLAVVGGNGVIVPPAPPPAPTVAPTVAPSVPLPSDWYVPPTAPPASPRTTPRPGSSGGPMGTPPVVALPESLSVTATAGERYGDTWAFELVLPGGYDLDTDAFCRWTMSLVDGRTISTGGPARDGFCGAWRVTLPYVPAPSIASDYPAVVTLQMSGRDNLGNESQIASSPYNALPLDGVLSTALVESSLPLLWLDASTSFDESGRGQLRLHWLQVTGNVESLATSPAGLEIGQITPQVYEIRNNGTMASGSAAVITVTAGDPSSPDSAFSATVTIRQAP